MSGANVEEFLGYWESEGEAYARRGDYDWMAAQVPVGRVLEIGCGVGFGTVALIKRGCTVLAIDSLAECLASAQAKTAEMDGGAVSYVQTDLQALDEVARQTIEAFAPETVVCWLMGAPASTTGASTHDGGQAVAAYREKLHRLVAELAVVLPTVRTLHLVDRTAIPWQAKDIGRDTLVGYHSAKTLVDLPLAAERRNALYRKLDDKVVALAGVRHSHPALKSVVPVLASLVVERKK